MPRALSDFADVSDVVVASLKRVAVEPVDTRLSTLFRILARSEGPFPRAEHLARLSGFDNRSRLNRTLTRHGFVSIERLEGWVRLLHAIAAMEVCPMSLERYALVRDVDVRTLHQHCKKLMRARWTIVREAGLACAITWLQADCMAHDRRPSRAGHVGTREIERAG